MKIKKSILLKELTAMTNTHLEMVAAFKSLPDTALIFQPSPGSWNLLECMEHLVRYGNFYIPAMQKAISAAPDEQNDLFKSGILGEKFATMMLPKPGMKKIKTFKNMDPKGSCPDRSILDTMQEQLHSILRILEQAAHKNLGKIKTPISITKLVKLRLGDTLRVVIYHNDRHMVQANNILESGKFDTKKPSGTEQTAMNSV